MICDRLQKDVASIRDINGLKVFETEDASTVVITLPYSSATSIAAEDIMEDGSSSGGAATPAFSHMDLCVAPNEASISFLISVSKFYPHVCPLIRCLALGFSNSCITADGTVLHPLLGEEGWSAIMSLHDVVMLLVQILETPPDTELTFESLHARDGASDNNNSRMIMENSIFMGGGEYGQQQQDALSPTIGEDATTDAEVNSVTFDLDIWEQQLEMNSTLAATTAGAAAMEAVDAL